MDRVHELKTKALALMEEHGYKIHEEITLEVDPKLPFMGYTTERDGQTVIVIAGWSLKTDMVMGLIIHELSHIYRTESGHPSHNFELHNKVLVQVLKGLKIYPYQKEILFNLINHLEDLYADDISIKVFFNDAKSNDLSEFFLGWVKEPIKSPKTSEDRWKNAAALCSAAFALSNLRRHNVEDTGNKVQTAVDSLISKLGNAYRADFDYFVDVMTSLPKDPTDEVFTTLLADYIRHFLTLVEGN